MTSGDHGNITRQRLLSKLPEFEYFPKRGEVDSYGLSYLIAKNLNKMMIPKSFATWTHGWHDEPIVSPEQVAQNSNKEETNLVSTKSIKKILTEEHNYENVHAVGLPFIYANPLPVNRIKNSLLVMPPHSLSYTEENWDEKEYVDSIVKISNEFDHVFACIHRHDIKKNNWIDTFSSAGIPFIPGTRTRDKNGLIRMQTLFHLFESVTSNRIGSHIAYASYCGCKVSLYGPYANFTIDQFKNDPSLSEENHHIREFVLHHRKEQQVKEQYPFLFVHPKQAVKRKKWAKQELGESNKLEFQELANLLGWNSQHPIHILYSNMKREISKFLHWTGLRKRLLVQDLF